MRRGKGKEEVGKKIEMEVEDGEEQADVEENLSRIKKVLKEGIGEDRENSMINRWKERENGRMRSRSRKEEDVEENEYGRVDGGNLMMNRWKGRGNGRMRR